MGMPRFLPVLVVLALAGCATPGGTPSGPPTALPTGRVLVAQWTSDGGFVPPGTFLITPPKLAVYSDGTAISAATSTLTLTPAEVTALIGKVRADLDGMPPTVRSTGRVAVADGPTDTISIRRDDGTTLEVSAYALGMLPGYPAALVDAQKTMSDLAGRVATSGSPYTSDRIKLVVAPDGMNADVVKTWPAGIDVPAVTSTDYRGVAVNLSGAQAQTAMAVFRAAGYDHVRLPDGTLVSVQWRYLLPHE
jgi:hypothetical protein